MPVGTIPGKPQNRWFKQARIFADHPLVSRSQVGPDFVWAIITDALIKNITIAGVPRQIDGGGQLGKRLQLVRFVGKTVGMIQFHQHLPKLRQLRFRIILTQRSKGLKARKIIAQGKASRRAPPWVKRQKEFPSPVRAKNAAPLRR